MEAATRTTTRLLEGLFDTADDATWREFDARYRPIVVGVARRVGLSADDAADVAQETLARFVTAYRAGKYDRAKGRLRSWIIGIARFRIADHRARRSKQREVADVERVEPPDDSARLEEFWQSERRAAILRRALDELPALGRSSPRTIRAFELVALAQRPAADVARELGMSTQDVYQAKRRISARLAAVVAHLESIYDEEGA